jgi:hypothetical protein
MFDSRNSRTAHVIATGAIIFIAAAFSSCSGGGGGGNMPPPQSNGLAFAAPVHITSDGNNPGSIVIADFNGDGKLDIAVSNRGSNSVAVFLNNGDGTFASPIVSTVQIAAQGLISTAVGDFNGDGKPDLIVATIGGTQTDIVLLGKGDGTFEQLSPIPGSGGFITALVVDLRGNGHQDLVLGTNGGIDVALGNGDGTFSSSTSLSSNLSPGVYFGVTVGKFTGNGRLDIVGADIVGQADGTFVYYAGNGDGTFQPLTSVSAPPPVPLSIANADFKGDGKLDLLIGFQASANIVLGNGDGTFQFATPISVYSAHDFGPTAGVLVQTADFNQDGKPDAVVADAQQGTLTVVLNAGLGQNPSPSGTRFQFSLAPGIAGIAVGDLNGDGLPDIAVTNPLTNQITVILSQKQ